MGSHQYTTSSNSTTLESNKSVLKYGNRCVVCGRSAKQGAVLNMDHIKPRARYPHLALDIRNLQPACSNCNTGKGNWDSTDWR
jgi:5-methylcytosine-specific restriction endonuclease McrA